MPALLLLAALLHVQTSVTKLGTAGGGCSSTAHMRTSFSSCGINYREAFFWLPSMERVSSSPSLMSSLVTRLSESPTCTIRTAARQDGAVFGI